MIDFEPVETFNIIREGDHKYRLAFVYHNMLFSLGTYRSIKKAKEMLEMFAATAADV